MSCLDERQNCHVIILQRVLQQLTFDEMVRYFSNIVHWLTSGSTYEHFYFWDSDWHRDTFCWASE